MRKLAWIITFTLVVCFLRSSAFDVHAADVVDYDELFARALTEANAEITNELIDAFFADTFTYMEELAFQNAQTKQAVIDLFVGDYVTAEQLAAIDSQRSSYEGELYNLYGKESTKTEADNRTAFRNAISYKQASLPGTYRDFSVLFDEVMTVSDGRAEGLSDEIARAAIAEPANMLRLLAKEEDPVQERVLSFLWDQSYTFRGTVLKERLTELRETESFTDQELALLDTILEYYVDSPEVTPPSDPDPEELANRATESQPTITEPTETEPTEIEPSSPVETEPPISEPSESEPTEPIPGDQPSIDGRWWITLCVAAAAVTIGFVCGKWYRKKQK